MSSKVNNLIHDTHRDGTMRIPRTYRHRGSVLVLVMTLLGVLFVMGIAFLASMNFEAELIDAQRLRDRNRMGAESVIDDLSAVLRDGLIAGPSFAFGTQSVGQSITNFADLPGVHNLGAPLEPMNVGAGRFVFGSITDLRAIKDNDPGTKPDGALFRQLSKGEDFAKALPFAGIDMDWPPGVPVFLNGVPAAALSIDIDGDFQNDSILPVDADGDGISDTLAFPLADLGFSATQIAALSAQLNPPTNLEGQVYLGLRVIPHGGMVNLNESHPLLIATALGIGDVNALKNPPALNLNYGFFRHRPSSQCGLDACTKYAPAIEESLLRRRNLLPPKDIPPSLLHGTPVNVATDSSAPGGADMAWMLYPLNAQGKFETVFSNDHGYTPFDPKGFDANCNAPMWAARMDPFVTKFMDTCNDAQYDRRHLVTTISHDDLLARGAQWIDAGGMKHDMLELMRQANRDADGVVCPDVLPFEYADYPPDIANETIPNIEGTICNCPTKGICRFDPRKGRLQLSLAWLDEQFPCASVTNLIGYDLCVNRRNRLIYDVFFMLLSNARGPYWDDVDCLANPCSADEVCDPFIGLCVDQLTGQRRSLSLKSRTAASLTANLIDYMDLECDGGTKNGRECRVDADCGGGTCMDLGLPTRIALRSFDFSQRTCVSNNTGMGTGTPCTTNANCGGNETCLSTAGWEFGSDRIPTIPMQYVYGLERQPYITEVATEVPPTGVLNRAVEIFNPYNDRFETDGDGDGIADYWLVEVDPAVGLTATTPRIRLNHPLEAGEFTVFRSGPGNPFGPLVNLENGRVFNIPTATPLTFVNGFFLYLMRQVTYPDGSVVEIVVDQVKIDGPTIGLNVPPTPPPPAYIASMPRAVAPGAPWKAPVPIQGSEVVGAHSLGTWNGDDPNIRPVEVQFANTGSFTRIHPFNDLDSSNYIPGEPPRGIAFPTTGSMLLTLRHANRSLDDYSDFTRDQLAFTTWLDRTTQVPNPTNAFATLDIFEREQVDNGRMPLFDPPSTFCVGPGIVGNSCNINAQCPTGNCVQNNVGNHICTDTLNPCNPNFECPGLDCQAVDAAHHVMPNVGACCITATTCQDVTVTECNALFGTFWLGADCANNACTTGTTSPGGIRNLPWGQLVFDYFTALPLSNPGPYENIDNTGKPDAQPRIDLDGLRVHGRININAAPWTVLAGLPLVPMNNIPTAFRAKVRWGAGIVDPTIVDHLNPNLNPASNEVLVNDNSASRIFEGLGQAIVAYRELRQIDDFVGTASRTTGNFGTDPNGRSWELDAPAARRGSGFVSVGELANVRHAAASAFPAGSGGSYSYHRFDFGEIGQSDADFVEAVGFLVALGDWVTVRSHVYTVYGTLRGDWEMDDIENPTIKDYADRTPEVTNRALRFQETIDRLPTFLGAPKPVRIGERVIRKFTDVNND